MLLCEDGNLDEVVVPTHAWASEVVALLYKLWRWGIRSLA